MIDEILGIVLVLTYLILPYFAIRVGRKKEGIHRLDFLGRIVVLVLIAVGLALLLFVLAGGYEGVFSIVFFIVLFTILYVRHYITVLRLNDVKWSPWWVFVSFIPMVGGVFTLVLLIVPPRKVETVALEAG